VTDTDQFLSVLRDDLGLPVTEGDLNASLDNVAGWDSLQLLSLLILLERRLGWSVPFAEALTASTLDEIRGLVAAKPAVTP
jgi:acyl carrier protein